jgi:FtsZ-binding cell division protein ZapB
VGGIFEKLPSTAQGNELPVAEKIDQIVQAIDQYQKEIENLREQLTPTTPPAVKEQRKQEATMQLQEIEQQLAQQLTCSIKQRNFGQGWRRIHRSNAGTRKRKGSMQ